MLASASPRRKELLQQLGVRFSCQAADIDESPLAGEAPQAYVARLANAKATAVFCGRQKGDLVIAADTTVVINNRILGKPRDLDHGLSILGQLSGRSHRVYTAICLLGDSDEDSQVVMTEVSFVELSEDTCRAYLATEEPWDKAGAYGIQGLGGAFVGEIHGSYSNVVGLPLAETWQMLRQRGVSTLLEPGRD